MLRWFFGFFKIFGKKHPNKIFLLECKIHGSHYYDCPSLIKARRLFVGENVIFRHQPDNEYDSSAIEVFTLDDKKLGYIPQKHSSIVSTLILQNCQFSATIEEIITTAWEPVTIRIFMHLS